MTRPHFNVAELVDEPGNHNLTMKEGEGELKNLWVLSAHDIMAMIVWEFMWKMS